MQGNAVTPPSIYAKGGPHLIIIIIITRLMTHVKVIHRVKNRKCVRPHIFAMLVETHSLTRA